MSDTINLFVAFRFQQFNDKAALHRRNKRETLKLS